MSAPSRFLAGFRMPFEALGAIRRTPGLRRLSVWVAITCMVLLIAAAFGTFHLSRWLLGMLWERPETSLVVLWHVLAWLSFGVLFVIAASLVTPLGTSAFLDPLSSETERAMGLPKEAGGLGRFVGEAARSISKNVLRLSLLFVGHVFLIAISFIPGVGTIYFPLSITLSAFGLAFEYIDIPGNRHGHRFRDTVRFIGRDRATALGFGLALYLLLWVPIVNCLLVPAGVVAATRLYHQRRAAEQAVLTVARR